jgi:hypothetical protein
MAMLDEERKSDCWSLYDRETKQVTCSTYEHAGLIVCRVCWAKQELREALGLPRCEETENGRTPLRNGEGT